MLGVEQMMRHPFWAPQPHRQQPGHCCPVQRCSHGECGSRKGVPCKPGRLRGSSCASSRGAALMCRAARPQAGSSKARRRRPEEAAQQASTRLDCAVPAQCTCSSLMQWACCTCSRLCTSSCWSSVHEGVGCVLHGPATAGAVYSSTSRCCLSSCSGHPVGLGRHAFSRTCKYLWLCSLTVHGWHCEARHQSQLVAESGHLTDAGQLLERLMCAGR